MLANLKKTINLASVVMDAGVELRSSGSRKVGRCPFHEDRSPSFFVFPDKFHCFGCGEHGDVVDFVQKMYGLTFKDALKYLGIELGRITPKVREDIERRKRRAELVREFKDWLNRYTAHIGSLIIETQELMRKGIQPEDLELYAPVLHRLPLWFYHLDILIRGSEEEQFLLYKEAQENGRGFRFRKAA